VIVVHFTLEITLTRFCLLKKYLHAFRHESINKSAFSFQMTHDRTLTALDEQECLDDNPILQYFTARRQQEPE